MAFYSIKNSISPRARFLYILKPNQAHKQLNGLLLYYLYMAFQRDKSGDEDGFDYWSGLSNFCSRVNRILFRTDDPQLFHVKPNKLQNYLTKMEIAFHQKSLEDCDKGYMESFKRNQGLSELCSELKNRFLTCEIA